MRLQSFKPIISTTSLACGTTAGSTTVTSSNLFGNVTVGMRLVGAGIPFGSTVTAKATNSSITISKPATATGTPTLQFAYFTSAIYAANDALGFPFNIGSPEKIAYAYVLDSDRVITAVRLVFMNDTFIETLDNAPFTINTADKNKYAGILSLTAANLTVANNNVMDSSGNIYGIDLPNPRDGNIYCQLICVGTPTFTAIDSLTVNLVCQ